jgi:hypothetical protein
MMGDSQLVRVAIHRKLAIMAAANDVAQKELASEILKTMLTEHKDEVEQIIKKLRMGGLEKGFVGKYGIPEAEPLSSKIVSSSSSHHSIQEFIEKHKSPLDEKVDAEMRKIIQKYGVGYKRDLGFLEFPRPEVSSSKFQYIATEVKQKLGELGCVEYDVFETTIIVNFLAEKKAYEEWEKIRR